MTRDSFFASPVQPRLLSNGDCEGGTPEAFYRRKRERARARKEQELEKARRAVALVAEIRARNAAAISAARNRNDSTVGREDRSNTVATTVVQGALGSPNPALGAPAEADDVREAANKVGDGVEAEAVVAAAGERKAGEGAGGGAAGGAILAGRAGVIAAVSSAAPAPAPNDCLPNGSDARTKLSLESGASNDDVLAVREGPESAIKKPHGDRDEDVRRYEQGFRGLSSAYGAYSSVFNSQVRVRFCRHVSQESISS